MTDASDTIRYDTLD